MLTGLYGIGLLISKVKVLREHYLNVIHIFLINSGFFYLNFANKTPRTLLKINVGNFFSCQIFTKKKYFMSKPQTFGDLSYQVHSGDFPLRYTASLCDKTCSVLFI